MLFRDYDPQKDQTATHRIWREVGWLDDASEEPVLDAFLAAGHILVAEIDDQAECISASMPGTFQYLHEDLSFTAITAVTTGRIARKQGLAKRLTARLIAADAAAGAQVAGLGVFEQGFYNLLGFGSGSYEHWISFDPAQLIITEPPRVPRRLSVDDADAMHQALLRRQRGHGACTITPNAFTRADCQFGKGGFGLGLADAGNELTHFLWMREKGEHGPYIVTMMAFQNGRQFRELLGVLKNLGDQVRMVRMREPAGVQMQDFLAQPFRFRQLTEKSPYQQQNRATAYWQVRMCDVPGCLAKTRLRGETVRFNLHLTDPIRQHLPADSPWQGVAGDYVVTLGPESQAEPGSAAGLATVSTSVGTWTRLWLGVLPASSLAAYADLQAAPELISAFDLSLCLPTPHFGWDF